MAHGLQALHLDSSTRPVTRWSHLVARERWIKHCGVSEQETVPEQWIPLRHASGRSLARSALGNKAWRSTGGPLQKATFVRKRLASPGLQESTDLTKLSTRLTRHYHIGFSIVTDHTDSGVSPVRSPIRDDDEEQGIKYTVRSTEYETTAFTGLGMLGEF